MSTTYRIPTDLGAITVKQSETAHDLTCFSMTLWTEKYDAYAWAKYDHTQGKVIATIDMKFSVQTPTGRPATGKQAERVAHELRRHLWAFTPAAA
jgi:hypothetical protein